MHLRLIFHQTTDERLLVLTEMSSTFASSSRSACATRAFDHEDIFLRRVVEADLDDAATRDLIVAVLLTVSQPARPKLWLDLDLDRRQIAAMDLDGGELPDSRPLLLPFPFSLNTMEFHRFLMQAPTPFVMLSGPDHRFTFINQPYVDMIGRTHVEDVLGKSIREALPELEERPFFHLLDEVFRTQIPYVGVEVPARIWYPYDNSYDDRHYDCIYHPIIGPDGKTAGIMVQTTDVTERVLAREVSDKREQQLFRQWTELDTIYRTTPAAMALFSANELEILRLNDRQAEWMGSPASELVGKRITSLPFHSPLYVSLLRQAAAGEAIRDYLFRDTFCAEVVPVRVFLLSLSPFHNAAGEIEAITSIAVEQLPGIDSPEGYIQSQPEPVL